MKGIRSTGFRNSIQTTKSTGAKTMVGVPHLTGRQKLYTALVMLASEPGRIDERLEKAYRASIVAIDAQLDIPAPLLAEFLKIRAELQKEFFGGGSSRFKSERDRRKWASRVAARLVSFYDELARFTSPTP